LERGDRDEKGVESREMRALGAKNLCSRTLIDVFASRETVYNKFNGDRDINLPTAFAGFYQGGSRETGGV
jgi:hypothetical protein